MIWGSVTRPLSLSEGVKIFARKPAALVEWFGPLLMMVSVPGCPGFESAMIRWLGGLDVGPEKRFVYVAPCHKRAVPPLHDSESNGARAVGRPYPSG